MCETFLTLTTSDKIQAIAIVANILISVISVTIAILTLRQTNKITKEANRPYLAIYYELIQVTSTFTPYLVLKNFGNTGAIIDSVTYSPEFKNEYNKTPFLKLSNHFIAPNQSIVTACKFEKPHKSINFTVKYHNGTSFFTESFVINPESIANLVYGKVTPNGSNNLEKIIVHSAQELIRTRL